jgi:hypothetical protein
MYPTIRDCDAKAGRHCRPIADAKMTGAEFYSGHGSLPIDDHIRHCHAL